MALPLSSPRARAILKTFGRRFLFQLCLGSRAALEMGSILFGAVAVMGLSSIIATVGLISWFDPKITFLGLGPAQMRFPASLLLLLLASWAVVEFIRAPDLRAECSWSNPLHAIGLFLASGFLLGLDQFRIHLATQPVQPFYLTRPLRLAPTWTDTGATPLRWRACLAPLGSAAAQWGWIAKSVPAWTMSMLWLCVSALLCISCSPLLGVAELARWLWAIPSRMALASSVAPIAPGAPAPSFIARVASGLGAKARGYAQQLADESGADLAKAEKTDLSQAISHAPADAGGPPRL